MTVPVEFAGVSGIPSVSGISRKRCEPLRHGFAVPPPLAGEALASRHVFDDFAAAPFGFIENETSLPRALLPGELASGCETERLDKGRL